MNIFGVGGWELLLIVTIALIVAGPKRIAVWMYMLGQFAGKLQNVWSEFAGTLQKEMDDAGIDVEIPRTPPTRADLTRSVQNIGRELTKTAEAPVKEVVDEVKGFGDRIQAENKAIGRGLNGVAASIKQAETSETPDPTPPKEAEAEAEQDEMNLGTWGGSKSS
jgi:Sec-independent protein translocase protein TatA